MRLDLALVRLYPELSRRKAREVIEKGQVTVDGERATEPGCAVPEDAKLCFDPNRKALSRARLSLPSLYKDESIIVVDKPAGLLTVPSSRGAEEEATALACVQEYVVRLTPHRPYVGVVHRIDRDTSGTLAFALSPAARKALRALFREHRIERRYLAIVEGAPRGEKGAVDLPIRDAYRGGRRGVAGRNEPSLPAVTRWEVLERFDRAALVEVELETGRQHQIRAHLAHVGLPILGDGVYRPAGFGPPPIRVRRQMLHARLLAFVHPLTGTRVRVESPLPKDFTRTLGELRKRDRFTGLRRGGQRGLGAPRRT